MTSDAPDTTYRTEYRRELESWLRLRYRTLCYTYLALSGVMIVSRLLFGSGLTAFVSVCGWLVNAGVVCVFLYGRRWSTHSRRELLAGASLMIMLLGGISLIDQAIIARLSPTIGGNFLVAVFIWHIAACLLLPWTPRESLRPVVPLMLVWVIGVLLLRVRDDTVTTVLTVIFSPGVFIPGLAVCSWRMKRHSREFRIKMIGRQFMTLRREFSRARTVHESLFPEPYDDGFVKFQYSYSPMRELGGDFVHLEVGPEGLVHLTLIDVTGHGLAAALSVNRIAGELERIRAESPGVTPDTIIRLLNKYIHLTMARHNIFASGLCLSIDPYLGQVLWASGGHPPAFLRAVNGTIRPLASTGPMLGALGDDEYVVERGVAEIEPGDVVVAYTDGAFEARGKDGTLFGLDRLRELLTRRPAPGNWPQFMASIINKHNAGRAGDDVLIASVTLLATRAERASS